MKNTTSLLSATAIAKKLGKDFSAKDVNSALKYAKLIENGKPSKKGSYLCKEKKRGELIYYAWNLEKLKRNKDFLFKIKGFSKKSKTISTQKKNKNKSSSGVYHMDRGAFKDLWSKELHRLESSGAEDTDIQKHLSKKAGEFRLKNGMIVRSKAEYILGTFLIQEGIIFSYEKRVEDVSENILSDFYMEFREIVPTGLKVHKIYIELWGFENDPKYLSRKKEKIGIYKKNNKVLIQLDDSFLSADFDSVFPLEFKTQYGRRLKDLRNKDFEFRIAMD